MDIDTFERGEGFRDFGLVFIIVGVLLEGGLDPGVQQRLPFLEPGQVPRRFTASHVDIMENGVDRFDQDFQALLFGIPENLKSMRK